MIYGLVSQCFNVTVAGLLQKNSTFLCYDKAEYTTWQKQPLEMFFKKMFIKISQISQEKTCRGVSF